MAEDGVTVLSRFRASVAALGFAALVEVGRVVGRVVVEVRDTVVGGVAGFVAGLAVEDTVLGRVVGFFSAVTEAPATLDLRSTVEVAGFVGARVEGVPARDMRLAVPEMPFFSSLELATERGFSSAELLTDARERWEGVEALLRGLRAAVLVVVGGRVGGLFNVPPLVEVRAPAVVGFETPDMEVGRFVVDAEPDKGRLEVEVEVAVLVGDALTFSLEFSLSLGPSGLVMGSSLPDMMVDDSTGVAGGAFSESFSAAGGGGTGSSVEAMVYTTPGGGG